MRYSVRIHDQPHTIAIEEDAQGQLNIQVDDQPISVHTVRLGTDRLSVLIGDYSYDLFTRPVPSDNPDDTQRYEVVLDGQVFSVDLVDERRRALGGLARGRRETGMVTLKAPMPGLVAAVLVAAGDQVEHGQRLVILEAMKMRNDLTAPRAGVIQQVVTAEGAAVNQGQPLLVIGDAVGQSDDDEESGPVNAR